MTYNPVVIEDLCNEHAAVHIHYPEEEVSRLISSFRARGALIADLELPAAADTPQALAEYFSHALNFPEVTRNWNAVNDRATNPEIIGNPVATLVVVRGLSTLTHHRPEDRALPIKLWARGVRIFQFTDQAFHAVLVGDDPADVDIAQVFRERVPIYRMNPEMLANIGFGSARIPVYDWQTGTPELLIE